MVTDRREMRQMKNQSVKEQEAEIKEHKNLVGWFLKRRWKTKLENKVLYQLVQCV